MPTELHKKPFIWFYGVLLTEELTNRENITSLCRYKDGWDKIHVVQNQPWPAWAVRQRGTVTRFKILPISSSLSMCNFLSLSLRWFPFGWSTVRSGLYCAALGSWRQLWSCVFRARKHLQTNGSETVVAGSAPKYNWHASHSVCICHRQMSLMPTLIDACKQNIMCPNSIENKTD